MRLLLFLLLFSIALYVKGQHPSRNHVYAITPIDFVQKSNAPKTNQISTVFNLQEAIYFRYRNKTVCFFVIAENILNEITKTGPAVDKQGFHYKSNPFLEIEETKGNTGFIKLGIEFLLRFR